ncbi:TM2 domain-containing protein [Thioclava sediminum]|uniref:TM2 domain-containing protein n=1 Tax=Thioclava sediminum TaxID=1915319 RepID=UPI001FC9BFA8|nr:TM2 domain-containing protein [Thioclava sediminum]
MNPRDYFSQTKINLSSFSRLAFTLKSSRNLEIQPLEAIFEDIMALTTEQQILIEQRIANDAKSPVVAYLLWFFLGMLGAHRFYLGKTGTGVAQLILCILGWLTLVVYVGIFLLLALGVWVLVDAFLIPSIITQSREKMRMQLGGTMAPAIPTV